MFHLILHVASGLLRFSPPSERAPATAADDPDELELQMGIADHSVFGLQAGETVRNRSGRAVVDGQVTKATKADFWVHP